VAELQVLIDGINVELAELQVRVNPVAMDWAELRIDNGDYVLAEPGESRRPPGAIFVRVFDPDGPIQDVYIRPGECAELDVITADVDALLESGRRRIREYIASCMN
jgi:hypothetical protein